MQSEKGFENAAFPTVQPKETENQCVPSVKYHGGMRSSRNKGLKGIAIDSYNGLRLLNPIGKDCYLNAAVNSIIPVLQKHPNNNPDAIHREIAKLMQSNVKYKM